MRLPSIIALLGTTLIVSAPMPLAAHPAGVNAEEKTPLGNRYLPVSDEQGLSIL